MSAPEAYSISAPVSPSGSVPTSADDANSGTPTGEIRALRRKGTSAGRLNRSLLEADESNSGPIPVGAAEAISRSVLESYSTPAPDADSVSTGADADSRRAFAERPNGIYTKKR